MRVGVIGGGPAGGAAALGLARGGIDVVLISPEKRGEKPCGGAVPERLLPALDGFDAAGLPAARPAAAGCENGAGSTVQVPIADLRIFRRGDFDGELARAAVAAGASSLAARAEALDWEDGRPVVTAGGRRRSLDYVLAADGARGLCRRTLHGALGELLAPRGESVGLGASLEGEATTGMVLGFPGVADAYAWVFPRPGGASVGLAYSPELLSDGAAGVALAGFVGRHLPRRPGMFRPRYRYPIPVYGPWTLPAVEAALGRRVLLLGDAAGVADPLTREGIRYAALSGQWAAESLLEGRPESYPARLAAGLDGELSRARRALGPFYEDSLAQWMVPLARLHPGIRSVLGDLLACRQPYLGLRRRLLRAAVGGGREDTGRAGASPEEEPRLRAAIGSGQGGTGARPCA